MSGRQDQVLKRNKITLFNDILYSLVSTLMTSDETMRLLFRENNYSEGDPHQAF